MSSSIFRISLFILMISQLQFPRIFSGYVYAYEEGYSKCSASFSCGNLEGIGYPFWRNDQPEYCGHPGFKLDCLGDKAIIDINSQKYDIIEIDYQAQILNIAKIDFMLNICLVSLINITLDFNLFEYTVSNQNASLLYDCDRLTEDHQPRIQEFTCPINNRSSDCYFAVPAISSDDELSSRCNISILIPVLAIAVERFIISSWSIDQVIKEGFEVKWIIDQGQCNDCLNSGGKCGYNRTVNEFTCFCPDQAYARNCPWMQPPANTEAADLIKGQDNSNRTSRIGIGFGAGMMGIIITCAIICIFRWKKISSILWTVCCRKVTKSDQDLEAFIRNYGSLAPKRYSFPNIKKMTNSFKDELGQGGYGRVYKGKLSDGRLVAVKLLNASKGNGQEFINEVASISRTSHVNVVTLLGFCLEGSKRALIYEFMPKGSLEKFVYNEDTSKPSPQHLGWDRMYEIVLGIAQGLEYLHRGCNTRILHFDIKPQNILLDQDFVPKISDFGLSKLCHKKESIVSMSEARGTIGYIVPEVFNRNFGEVSHKSDVYSYGMMIMELVGCKSNLDSGIDHSSEIYFPHWIYKHVEQGKEFKLPGVVTSKESEIVKKMIIIALWCIQYRPSHRPPMNRVIEMLQESNEALQTPPMPFLSSPPRAPITYSSTISTS